MSENPCRSCLVREIYAKMFDIHISGEDCPYFKCTFGIECEKYEKWKDEQNKVKDYPPYLDYPLRKEV